MSKTKLNNLSDQAFLRGFILRAQKDLVLGQVIELERTPLGGMLEAVNPHNGIGHHLSDNIEAACEGLEGVEYIPVEKSTDGKVRVKITGI
jgi:hypothetical protein